MRNTTHSVSIAKRLWAKGSAIAALVGLSGFAVAQPATQFKQSFTEGTNVAAYASSVNSIGRFNAVSAAGDGTSIIDNRIQFVRSAADATVLGFVGDFKDATPQAVAISFVLHIDRPTAGSNFTQVARFLVGDNTMSNTVADEPGSVAGGNYDASNTSIASGIRFNYQNNNNQNFRLGHIGQPANSGNNDGANRNTNGTAGSGNRIYYVINQSASAVDYIDATGTKRTVNANSFSLINTQLSNNNTDVTYQSVGIFNTSVPLEKFKFLFDGALGTNNTFQIRDFLIEDLTPALSNITTTGTYSVGTNQQLGSLTGTLANGGAFALLNDAGAVPTGGVTFELYGGSEPGSTALNELTGMTSPGAVTIRPADIGETVLVSSGSSQENGWLTFSGADNVLIDGRVVGDNSLLASSRKLILRATNNGGSGIGFLNGAQNNVVQMVEIQGGSSNNRGLITLLGTTGDPNSNNTFQYNLLTYNKSAGDNAGNKPQQVLRIRDASAAAGDAVHINNVFYRNTFEDYGRGGQSSTVVFLQTGYSETVFRENSFYTTSAIPVTGNNTHFIFRTQATGPNNKIVGNFYGGTAPNCGGSPMTYNLGSGFVRPFFLRIESSTGTSPLIIDSNTIDNMDIPFLFNSTQSEDYWTTSTALFQSEDVAATNVDFRYNKFGDTQGIKFSIQAGSGNMAQRGMNTTFGSQGEVIGNSFRNWEIVIQSAGSDARSFSGTLFAVQGSPSVVSGNTFENIEITGSGANIASDFTIFRVTLPNISSNTQVTDNIVRNITHSVPNASGSVEHTGSTGAIIENKLTAMQVVTKSTTASFLGNKVYNITSIDAPVTGLSIADGSGSFGGPANITFANNVVSVDASATNNFEVVAVSAGVYADSVPQGTTYFVHNSVNVGGTSSTASNAFAFKRTGTAPVLVQNNILNNVRTNTGSGSSFGISSDNATGFTSTNNAIFGATDFGQWLGVSQNTQTAWNTASGQDAAGTPGSQSVAVAFNNANAGNFALVGCNLPTDVAAALPNPPGAVTTDIDGANRPTLTPGAVYFDAAGPSTNATWTGGANNTNWFNPANWCGGVPDGTIDAIISSATSPMPTVWPVVDGLAISTRGLTVEGTATLSVINAGTANIAGDYVKTGAGVVNFGNSTLNFNTATAQLISGLTAGGATVTLSSSAKTFANTNMVGSLSIAGSAPTTIDNGATLTVNGAITGMGAFAASNFGTLVIAGNTADNATINGSDFAALNVTRTGGGTAILGSNLNLGSVNMTGSSVLDFNSQNVTMTGSITQSGGATINNTGNAGTLTMGGILATTLGGGTVNVNNLTATRAAAGSVTINGTVNVGGVLTVATGQTTFNAGAGSSLSIGAPVVNNGTLNISPSANLGLTGTAVIPGGATTYNNLTVAATVPVVAPGNSTINGVLTLGNGAVYDVTGRTITVVGNVVNQGGLLRSNASTTLNLQAGGTVTGGLGFGPAAGDQVVGTLNLERNASLASNATVNTLPGSGTLTVAANTLTVPATVSLANVSTNANSTLGFTGSANVVLPAANSSLAGLVVGTTGGVTLNQALSLAQSLTLSSGNLFMTGGNLTYGGTSSPSASGSNHVVLPPSRSFVWNATGLSGNLNFPAGPDADVSGNRPVTVSPAAPYTGTLTLSYANHDAANTTVQSVADAGNIRADYVANVNASTAFTGGLTLTAQAADFNDPADQAELALFRGVGTSQPWERLGQTSVVNNAGLISVNRAGVSFNSGANWLVVGEGQAGSDLPAAAAGGNFVWTGAISTNWNTSGNWDVNAVPNATNQDVSIPNTANKPVVESADDFEIGTLVINSGANVTVNGTLTVANALTANGVIMGNAGSSVNLLGGAAMNLNASPLRHRFHNLTVNKSGSPLTANAPLDVTGTLNLQAGVFNLNGQNLRLVATASSRGRIGTLATPANLQNSSNVTVQTWLPSGINNPAGAFMMTGSAVNNTTLGTYASMMPFVTGSFYSYDPFGNPVTEGWEVETNPAFQMEPTRGAYVFFTQGMFNKALSLTGPVNKGAITTPSNVVEYCASGCATAGTNGFNIISNPYPSAIDWNNSGITLNNVGNAIYIWRFDQKNYASYVRNDVSGTLGATNIIPQGQGFFVDAIAASPSVGFTEQAKVANVTSVLRTAQVTNRLKATVSAPNGFMDESIIQLNGNATASFDPEFDAKKWHGTEVNMFTLENNVEFSINARPMPANQESIGLVVKGTVDGAYTLNFAGIDNMTASRVFLKDNFTGIIQDLSSVPTYQFTLTSNAATRNINRFELIFSASVTNIAGNLGEATFSVYPNPANSSGVINVALGGFEGNNATVTITNMVGKTMLVEEVAINSNGLKVSQVNAQLASGVYMVTAEANGVRRTQKLVVN